MRSERGAALVIVLTVIVLLAAVGAGLTLNVTTETLIADAYRRGRETLDAADAAVARSAAELAAIPEWDDVVSGRVVSSLSDGPPAGVRTVADGSTVDPAVVVAEASVGAGAPAWRLFGSGFLSAIAPPLRIESPCYVVVLVGRDPASAGAILVRADAFGLRSAHRSVEALIRRSDVAGAVRVVRRREIP